MCIRDSSSDYYSKVSRVIYNRLDKDMTLGMDSTVAYGASINGMQLTNDQLQDTSNPYNTRVNRGLPPTPISNPGDDAIEAAMHPADGNWLYFVTTDLKTLENTNVLSDLLGSKNGTLDASRIASFMLSPTVLDTHTLYPIDTYGSGMAPLFTSLALWVGVFMLMVLFKLEVDNEGLEGRHVTTNQTYMARYLLLAIVAGLQGIVCAVGDLIIRVQCANRFVFILTAWLTSLAYLAIAYALSATFMHVGKALVVALVMLQIPGASGLYPIEMMPDFYRALYPFLSLIHI